MRYRIGSRNHVALFEQHNGNLDEAGQPTYETEADWIPIGFRWPCEMVATSGGEVVRGRQVTDRTTYVLFGEYFGSENVDATCRVSVGGQVLYVAAVYDQTGWQMERRIELKQER